MSTTESTDDTSQTTTSSTDQTSSSDFSENGSEFTPLKTEIAQPSLYAYPGGLLGPDEMRVTIVGSGMANYVRRTQADCSIFVELGNGDSFLFDLGVGSFVNLQTLSIPMSRTTKVFFSHLHMDHMNDLPALYTFGPSGGRYQPLRLWGPSGQTPELGFKACIEGLKQFCRWHTVSFETSQPIDGSYDLEVNELDYRLNPGVAYEENGVKITHWPALHVIDGAISYRLDWNGLSFVWSGDTEPNQFFVENAQNVDLMIHETFPSLLRFEQVFPDTVQAYEGNVSTSHTTALCYGKVLSLTNPRYAVTNHCVVDDQEVASIIDDIRVNWKGPYQIGTDFMVFTVSKDTITSRRAAINEQSWGAKVGSPTTSSAPLDSSNFRSPAIFDQAITDCSPSGCSVDSTGSSSSDGSTS